MNDTFFKLKPSIVLIIFELKKEGFVAETEPGYNLTKKGMRHSSSIAQWLMEKTYAHTNGKKMGATGRVQNF